MSFIFNCFSGYKQKIGGGGGRQTKTICQHHHQPIKAVFCSSSTRMLANSKSLGAQISAKTKLNTLNMLELFIFHWPNSTLVCKQKTNTWARFPIALDQCFSVICSSSSWLLAINYYIWRKYMKKACTKKNSRELYRKKVKNGKAEQKCSFFWELLGIHITNHTFKIPWHFQVFQETLTGHKS